MLLLVITKCHKAHYVFSLPVILASVGIVLIKIFSQNTQ